MAVNNLRDTIVHFSNKDILIESSGRFITIYKHQNEKKRRLKLPFSFPRDFYFNVPLLKRLLRSDAKEIIYDYNSDKLIIIRNSTVYLINESSYNSLGTIDGDAPLFNSHCIHKGIIYFGQFV